MTKKCLAFKQIAVIFSFLIVSQVALCDSIRIRPGTYKADRFTVRVERMIVDPWYEIEARGRGTEFVRFLFNAETANVVKSPYGVFGIEHGEGARVRNFALEYSRIEGGSYLFKWSHGGWFSSHEEWIEISLSVDDGSIQSVSASTKIARWGFANGLHSGPFKQVSSELRCSQLLSAPTTEGQLLIEDLRSETN